MTGQPPVTAAVLVALFVTARHTTAEPPADAAVLYTDLHDGHWA